MAKLVSKVYGDALFETAVEKEKVDALYEEAQALTLILGKNPQLMVLLNNPQIVKDEKVAVMHQIFSGRVEEEMMGFLKLVVEKDRQNDIASILGYFIQKVKEFRKIGVVNVSSAVELNDKQKAALENKLLAATSYKKLEMHYQVDQALIGGMVVRIGDRVADSSIRTRIYKMKQELYSIQLG